DYGMGNIHSVQKALQNCGAEAIVTNQPEKIASCAKAVLPGVGAFDDAMRELEKQDLIPAIRQHLKENKPFLGICLGMQLLFEQSAEAKEARGLAVFKGAVKKFPEQKQLKVPHMGWNTLSKVTSECPLLRGIPDESFVYFCHSYYPEPEDKNIIASVTDYGFNFASMVCKDNIFGVQFHPEKSQTIGLQILRNFVEC
ncbi:MAG: imidazole glycerol phosphate synthase subunit HisH, partial [Candidatus Omnitrophota bacterium]|nr:imidazole glycerol phosphate synthase subunit HisH [Candidatus Omnitrophota bacterium]